MKVRFVLRLAVWSLGIAPRAGAHQAAQGSKRPSSLELFAGDMGGAGSADGRGGEARFDSPYSVATDSAGNVYVADSNNNAIRKITPAGVVSTFAGKAGGDTLGSAEGTGAAARFNHPHGIATDRAGNVYVADTTNSTIRKITPAGVVSTFAGEAGEIGSADGIGAAARFRYPEGIATDGAGNVYVADTYNSTIRKVTPAGAVSTLAGKAGAGGSVDGNGAAARFDELRGIATDGAGNLYVANLGNYTIRKITAAGVVTTFAGTPGVAGYADGNGAAARFEGPLGVATDRAGNVYVGGGYTVRKIAPDGTVSTLAGNRGVIGSSDGTGAAASFDQMIGVATDRTGNVYVADNHNNTIRKVTPAGVVTTLAGKASVTGNADGSGAVAGFKLPGGLAADRRGNVYVADTFNNSVRKITPDGVVTTLAGPWAGFSSPSGITVDSSGNVFGADSSRHTIRELTPAGELITLAGKEYVNGTADGSGAAARFDSPSGVALDGAGNLYVADTGNHAVRKITPSGVVTTLAGKTGESGSVDGTGAAARFEGPTSVAVDGAGNVYVAESNTLRKITPTGVVTTFARKAGEARLVSVFGTVTRIADPQAVATDDAGNVYVADGATISKLTPAGVMNTLAGKAGVRGNVDGLGAAARFNQVYGIAADRAGNLYAVDGSTIRKITPEGAVSTLAGKAGESFSRDGSLAEARLSSPGGIAPDRAGNIYVVDGGVRMITTGGQVITLAGRTTPGGSAAATRFNASGMAFDGAGNAYVLDRRSNSIRKMRPGGEATTYSRAATRMALPYGVAADEAGNLYVADYHRISKITPDGVVTTLAGVEEVSGSADGSGSAARFDGPAGIVVDRAGNIFVADRGNDAIRKITPDGTVTTFAGQLGNVGSADGNGAAARFASPQGMAIDGADNLYVAEGSSIRKITPAGTVSTLAGAAARFNRAQGVAVDWQGNVYVADTDNHAVRKITPGGTVSTLVGVVGRSGFSPGELPGLLTSPRAVTVSGGSLYITLYNGVAVVRDLPQEQ